MNGSIWQNGNDKRYMRMMCPNCEKIVVITIDMSPGFSDFGHIKCPCGHDLGEHRIDNGYEIEYDSEG